MFKRLARTAFPWLPAFRAAMARGQWREIAPVARVVGWSAALRLWFARCCLRNTPSARLSKMHLVRYDHPLYYRPGGSDPLVIDQVFVAKEYAGVASLSGIEFIVDCGANIGCTTFYLLHHYPRARAVVVEPDSANMALCRRNLAPFGNRITFIEAGVWSKAGPLVVDRGTYRDGAEWSIQIRPARAGENPDVHAVTIADAMAKAGFPRIDLLKVDIEAAELEVFDASASPWLKRVRNLAIELHGPACEHVVAEALTPFAFERRHSGELTLYLDIKATTPDAEELPRCS